LNFEQKFSLSKHITHLLLLALAVLFFASQLTRSSGPNWVVLSIQIGPLLCFIPGLVSQYYRVYSWLCFVLLLYFVVAVMEVNASNTTQGDSIFLALTVLLFVSSMLCSRYAQRVQKNYQH
jgi:uncharacterized membrane protein